MIRSNQLARSQFMQMTARKQRVSRTLNSNVLEDHIDAFVKNGGEIEEVAFGVSGVSGVPASVKLRGVALKKDISRKLTDWQRRNIRLQLNGDITTNEVVKRTKMLAKEYGVSYQTIRNNRCEQ